MSKAISHRHAGQFSGTPAGRAVLEHDERHLRRRLITLENGGSVLVDLPQTVSLNAGDVLVLEDGGLIEIAAATEALLEITGRSEEHLHKLCWHIGNRHLPAQIEKTRILIKRDHVIADMLTGLGAGLKEVTEPFSPERGAYHSHSHAHD